MITKTKLLKKALPMQEQVDAWNQYQDYTYNYETSECTYPAKPDNIVILFDHYVYQDYNGSGHVIGYNKDTKQLFEVYGSHCSCYGLEGQWGEEYTTLEEIAHHTKLQLDELNGREYKYSDDEESISRLENIKALLEI